MGVEQGAAIAIVNDKVTGERKVIIASEESGTGFVFNFEELKSLKQAVDAAVAYIEKHGTHFIESVPEGAVRH